ncbi:hypothetical protein CC86DRAFT_321965 [Ophiobolus disseminans]|uniref:DNA-directed RNA polymerase I subunit RPA34.5 n=1 Tax=Ophiobolus disseminans TaxID=1469910 RepID=A0A6A7A4K6_9PLEO|nr:hypothetical protein CC86DRAFT_321965 [Ophiobolus disseminans]
MKEVKRTPVPLPGSKPKPKANGTPSKAQLSQEFIVSDDDSTNENAPRPKTAPKPKTSIAVHRPDGSAKPKTKSKVQFTPKKPAPKQIATEEQAAELLSSSEQTDDDEAPGREIQTKLPGNEKWTDPAEESDSDSSSASSSEESVADKPPQSGQTPTRPPQKTSHAVEFRPAQAFVPPRGFNPVPCNDKTTSKSTRIFDHLEGKQIWHITAPAGVSLKHLQDIDMSAAMKGAAVLEHKGTAYGFSKAEQSDDGAREVMVPKGSGLKSAGARISQTLHLQAVVQLPHLSSKQADQNTGSEAAASITRSTIRAPRPQLKGLKMRFLPTGFSGGDVGTLGESDSEDDTPQETAGLGMPNELNLPSQKKKRKHVDVNGDVPTEVPSKKAKKHRTPEEKKARKEKKHSRQADTAKP